MSTENVMVYSSCTDVAKNICSIRYLINPLAVNPVVTGNLVYPANGVAGVPYKSLPWIEFLNDAPKNDVIYFVADNEVVIKSLTQKTTFDCKSQANLDKCTVCTTGANLPAI